MGQPYSPWVKIAPDGYVGLSYHGSRNNVAPNCFGVGLSYHGSHWQPKNYFFQPICFHRKSIYLQKIECQG